MGGGEWQQLCWRRARNEGEEHEAHHHGGASVRAVLDLRQVQHEVAAVRAALAGARPPCPRSSPTATGTAATTAAAPAGVSVGGVVVVGHGPGGTGTGAAARVGVSHVPAARRLPPVPVPVPVAVLLLVLRLVEGVVLVVLRSRIRLHRVLKHIGVSQGSDRGIRKGVHASRQLSEGERGVGEG